MYLTKGLIASLNFFGTTALVGGVKELLAKKQASVVLVSSNSATEATETTYPILLRDISYQVGFSDISSLLRSFRAWTKVTPKAYRDRTKPAHIQS